MERWIDKLLSMIRVPIRKWQSSQFVFPFKFSTWLFLALQIRFRWTFLKANISSVCNVLSLQLYRQWSPWLNKITLTRCNCISIFQSRLESTRVFFFLTALMNFINLLSFLEIIWPEKIKRELKGQVVEWNARFLSPDLYVYAF